MRTPFAWASLFLLITSSCSPASAQSTTQPAVGKLPHLEIDAKNKQVRIECQPCTENMNVGLEFFCVTVGSNEYESVLKTAAKPSDIHFALLSLGLQPGTPVRYSEATKKMIPPGG